MLSQLADREVLHRDGFFFPVRVFDEDKAAEYYHRVQEWRSIAARIGKDVRSRWNYPKVHLLADWADEFVHEEPLLDVAESVLGPDLMVWAINIFRRGAKSGEELAWHQDAPYFGWSDMAGKTIRIWVALTPTKPENGTLRFARGMHGELLPHAFRSKSTSDVMAGESVQVAVNEQDAVDVTLSPGEASMHLPTMVHCSGPNSTADDRVCVAVDYVTPNLMPSTGDSALMVRGADENNYFIHETRLTTPYSAEALTDFRKACHRRDRIIVGQYRKRASVG